MQNKFWAEFLIFVIFCAVLNLRIIFLASHGKISAHMITDPNRICVVGFVKYFLNKKN